jgi:hypothetical protein
VEKKKKKKKKKRKKQQQKKKQKQKQLQQILGSFATFHWASWAICFWVYTPTKFSFSS